MSWILLTSAAFRLTSEAVHVVQFLQQYHVTQRVAGLSVKLFGSFGRLDSEVFRNLSRDDELLVHSGQQEGYADLIRRYARV